MLYSGLLSLSVPSLFVNHNFNRNTAVSIAVAVPNLSLGSAHPFGVSSSCRTALGICIYHILRLHLMHSTFFTMHLARWKAMEWHDDWNRNWYREEHEKGLSRKLCTLVSANKRYVKHAIKKLFAIKIMHSTFGPWFNDAWNSPKGNHPSPPREVGGHFPPHR